MAADPTQTETQADADFDDGGPSVTRWLVALAGGGLLVGLLVIVYSARRSGPGGDPSSTGSATNPVATTTDGGAHEGLALDDPAVCGECHRAIHDEWAASQHRTSRTDDALRYLSVFSRSNPDAPECIACHQPGPMLELPAPEGPPPYRQPPARDDREEHGVDCASCHVRFGQVVGAGRSTEAARADAGCQPGVSNVLATSFACASCHHSYAVGTKHSFDEWYVDHRETPDAQSCADCHMPLVDGGPAGGNGQHRSHLMPGGHHPAFVASAVRLTLRVERDADLVVATLTNLGTGHRFPTGYKIRRLELAVVARDATGTITSSRSFTLQKPSRWGGRDGFQLPHGQSQEFEFHFVGDDWPAGTGGDVTATLHYKLWPRDEGVLIAEQRVALD